MKNKMHTGKEAENKCIFLLVNYTPADGTIGITKKISAQIRALRNLQHTVYYTAYVDGGTAVMGNQDEVLLFHPYPVKHRLFSSVLRYPFLLQTAKAFLNSSGLVFDLCYGRLSAPNGQYLSLLRSLKKKNTKVVIESLSYFPGMRPKALKSKYISFCLKKNRRSLAQCVDKLITEGEVASFYGIPTEKGRIGVDVAGLPPHTYTGDPDVLNLISVAREREYHGYDRLIKSYVNYKKAGGKVPVRIHLVGELYDSTKKIIEENLLSDNILLYGRVSGSPLYEIYAACNMGIGPLGQHRVGGKKDTGLKTKEYFGMGLPYFYSGTEEDLPEGYPYVLECPSDESDIDFDRIWEFYQTWKDKETVSEEMRQFASENFSWEKIMGKAIVV